MSFAALRRNCRCVSQRIKTFVLKIIAARIAIIVVAGVFSATVAAPIWILVVGTIVAAVYIGYKLDEFDKALGKTLGEAALIVIVVI